MECYYPEWNTKRYFACRDVLNSNSTEVYFAFLDSGVSKWNTSVSLNYMSPTLICDCFSFLLSSTLSVLNIEGKSVIDWPLPNNVELGPREEEKIFTLICLAPARWVYFEEIWTSQSIELGKNLSNVKSNLHSEVLQIFIMKSC